MKRGLLVLLAFVPTFVFADEAPHGLTDVFNKLKDAVFANILNPLIFLLFALALLYFLWGMVRFIASGEEPEMRKDGRRHMFWGIIGMAIMLSVFGIIAFVFNVVTDDGQAEGIDNKVVPRPAIIPEN
jgi:hypothetical protein